MFQYEEQKYLPYPPEFLFKLVLDVEAYPEFLPWCKAARIVSDDGSTIVANLIVGLAPIKQKFTSRVVYDKDRLTINTEYIDGPFEFMQSHWHFISRSNSQCHVDFSVKFALKKKLYTRLLADVFGMASKRMVKAFETRAAKLSSQNRVPQ